MSKLVKRWVLAVVAAVVVFSGVLGQGYSAIYSCGVYKPWKWNADKLWFVEDTCKYMHFTPKE